MPVLWHQDRSSNLDKAQIFVVLLPFLSTPYSRLFNAAQDLELTFQQFTLEGGSVLGGAEMSREGVIVSGGWKCRHCTCSGL